MDVSKVLDKILKLRKERNWSEYQLSQASGIPQSTISSWYRKDLLPSLTSLEKVCKAFKISLSQFFADSHEFLDLTKEQKLFLKKWNSLLPEQKEKLSIYLQALID